LSGAVAFSHACAGADGLALGVHLSDLALLARANVLFDERVLAAATHPLQPFTSIAGAELTVESGRSAADLVARLASGKLPVARHLRLVLSAALSILRRQGASRGGE
jgi:hypothetical protein